MIVSLTLAELLCVEFVLTPTKTWDETGPHRDMALRVGSALLDALDKPAEEVSIYLDNEELWILRERVNIYAAVGADQDLGIRLKAKIYKSLRAASAGDVLASLGMEVLSDDPEYVPNEDASEDAGEVPTKRARARKTKKVESREDLPGPDKAGGGTSGADVAVDDLSHL